MKLCGGIWGFGVFDNGDAAKIDAAKTFIKWVCDENTVESVKTSFDSYEKCRSSTSRTVTPLPSWTL